MIPVIRTRIRKAGLLNKSFRATAGLMVFMLLTGHSGLYAQVCTDLSYQPIVNESFGTGGQRLLTAGLSAYAYQTNTCPNDGEYIVSDVVDGTCFNSAWHPITEDHTPGDVRGSMLLINGWYEETEFYAQPVPTLCPGTTYEFSFWGINIINPAKANDGLLPNLTAAVKITTGALIQILEFGSITQTSKPTWFRFSGLFTVPDTVTQVSIHLISGKGGSGNDFGIDDIQVRQCGACAPVSLYVPDAFTPNNDGMNDELSVILREPAAFDMKIFNRWGNLVFASNAPDRTWNGTYEGSPCPPGEYTWTISYQTAQKTSSATRYSKTGHVMLLR